MYKKNSARQVGQSKDRLAGSARPVIPALDAGILDERLSGRAR